MNWALFGVLTLQTYIYHIAFPYDKLWTKAFSYTIYGLEVIQTLMLTQTAFYIFAQGFGNLSHLDYLGPVWFSLPVLSSAVAFMVQAVYAYRIKILVESKIVTSIVLVLAAAQLCGGIATDVLSKKARFGSKSTSTEILTCTIIWKGCSALCDVIITIFMTGYLIRWNTDLIKTGRTIRKVVRIAIETGLLTAVVALIHFILILLPGRHPTSGYYVVAGCTVGKLYSNSLMAIFNSRICLSSHATNSLTSVEFSKFSDGRSQEGNLSSFDLSGIQVSKT
ncbi:hypothetical protein CPB83DRAFT_862242 [Crepidotus variabilis]|uniref:DUF6534 domain-containing protein n=1 Tax=Crepidotus variabilis TaxID=179855 RepID=A0A9P6E6X7_9AGAR|nr:hypothetical protein CPB83DRAFT_862242 [Crepidotus variabilis]